MSSLVEKDRGELNQHTRGADRVQTVICIHLTRTRENSAVISGRTRNLLRSALTARLQPEAALAELAELNRYRVYGFLLSFIMSLFITLEICCVYFITVPVSYCS